MKKWLDYLTSQLVCFFNALISDLFEFYVRTSKQKKPVNSSEFKNTELTSTCSFSGFILSQFGAGNLKRKGKETIRMAVVVLVCKCVI
jgi:hypothetical protein